MKSIKLVLLAVALMVAGFFAYRAVRGRIGGSGGHSRGGSPHGESKSGAGPLSISRGNGRSATWKLEDLGRVRARNDISTERGAASAWSLRDVAAALLDKGERIGSLCNAQGETLSISPAEWADETRVPLLRVNHRGLWKFDWVDATTREPLAGGMRDVSGMTVSPQTATSRAVPARRRIGVQRRRGIPRRAVCRSTYTRIVPPLEAPKRGACRGERQSIDATSPSNAIRLTLPGATASAIRVAVRQAVTLTAMARSNA